jgi:hypothetical protein
VVHQIPILPVQNGATHDQRPGARQRIVHELSHGMPVSPRNLWRNTAGNRQHVVLMSPEMHADLVQRHKQHELIWNKATKAPPLPTSCFRKCTSRSPSTKRERAPWLQYRSTGMRPTYAKACTVPGKLKTQHCHSWRENSGSRINQSERTSCSRHDAARRPDCSPSQRH